MKFKAEDDVPWSKIDVETSGMNSGIAAVLVVYILDSTIVVFGVGVTTLARG